MTLDDLRRITGCDVRHIEIPPGTALEDKNTILGNVMRFQIGHWFRKLERVYAKNDESSADWRMVDASQFIPYAWGPNAEDALAMFFRRFPLMKRRK